MNQQLTEMYVFAIRQAMELDNVAPRGVGMGPSYRMLAEEIANKMSFDISDSEIEWAAEKAQKGR